MDLKIIRLLKLHPRRMSCEPPNLSLPSLYIFVTRIELQAATYHNVCVCSCMFQTGGEHQACVCVWFIMFPVVKPQDQPSLAQRSLVKMHLLSGSLRIPTPKSPAVSRQLLFRLQGPLALLLARSETSEQRRARWTAEAMIGWIMSSWFL